MAIQSDGVGRTRKRKASAVDANNDAGRPNTGPATGGKNPPNYHTYRVPGPAGRNQLSPSEKKASGPLSKLWENQNNLNNVGAVQADKVQLVSSARKRAIKKTYS